MPDNTQSFNVDAARKAGYSDDEILGHLTSTRAFDVQGAMKAGYSKQDIILHLSSTVAKAAPTPSQGDLATQVLAKQGLGPTASPGKNNFVPVDPYSKAPGDDEAYQSLEFGNSAPTTPEEAVNLKIAKGQPLSESEAWNSMAGNDPNPVLIGPAKMVGGAIDYTQSFTNPDPVDAGRAQRYSAGSNVIGGAMQTVTPLLPGAVAAAPIGTLAALGVAGGAGYTAKKATEASGGTKEAQDFAQNAAASLPYTYALGVRGGKFNVERPVSQEPIKGPAGGQIIPPSTSVAVPDTVATGIQGEALGGRIKGAVIKTSEGTTVAGKVGPYTASKIFKSSKPTEPMVTPIGEIQHPEATAPEENIGEFSQNTITNFRKQQTRAMSEGDTAAADALAGMLDADAAKKTQGSASKTPTTQPDRRQFQRSETSSVMLDQLHTQLRAATDPQEVSDLQSAISRETDLGLRDAAAKEAEQTEQPTQQSQAEPRAKTQAPRDIEGEVPTQGASQPISDQAPAFTAEQITHRNDFLKYQTQHTQVQKALEGAQAAAKGGFQRGAMNDAQVTWHQAELGRLETKMGDSLRNYARVSPPEHVDQLRAGLQRNLSGAKGTADRLGKLIQTDKAAKALRGVLPELPSGQRKAGRQLLGDLPDTTKMALKQAKFYSPKLKPRVDEAHKEIGDSLAGIVQQYGEGNQVATQYAVALKAGLKGDALTDAHLKAIMQIIPPQAKGEVGKLLGILKNETPVVLYHPAIRGTASSALPEINLRNLQQILGRKLHDKASRQITPEERFANKDLATADPGAAKAAREDMSRTLVQGLQKQATKRADFLQKQLNIIDKASGAGKRANETTLLDLINKRRTLKEISTPDLQALVDDTKTLHKQFPEMNVMQQAKAKLQGELTKRADADRQQKEILKFKVGQVLQPTSMPKAVAPTSNQLPQARYFADEWYQTPELAAAASVMDSKISKMSPSVIKKYLGPLAKKVVKGDKQSIALLNAYNKRLAEFGQAEIPKESLLEKQAKNITNPEQAPIGPQKGDVVEFQLPTGNRIKGTIEAIDGDKVKIVRENGQKNVQPLNRMVQKEVASTPPVIESKPAEAQKIEAIPAKPTGASVVGGGVPATPSASKQSALDSLSKLPDAGLSELAPKLIQFAKDRPDLDTDGRNNLITQMAEAAILAPKEKAMSVVYDIARKGAPPLSTWTAEKGGELRKRAVEVAPLVQFTEVKPGVAFTSSLGKDSNVLGLSGLRTLLKDFKQAHPDIKMLQFFRQDKNSKVSGSLYQVDLNNFKLTKVAQNLPVMDVSEEAKPIDFPEGFEVESSFKDPGGTDVYFLRKQGRNYSVSNLKTGQTLVSHENKSFPSLEAAEAYNRLSPKGLVPDSPKFPFQEPQQPSQAPAELDAARQQAIASMQAIEKLAGETGINRLRAIAKGLDIGKTGKVLAFNKALQLYADGLKVGDPSALARARDFLLAQNGEPNTGRMSLFGLDKVIGFLTNSQKTQIPVPSQRLENIRKAQAASKIEPGLLDKLRTLPYSVLTKMYDQFQYLDQNPTRFEKWFAPELIRDFEKRTGINNIRIDTNPWKQARLAYGGGGGVVHAAAIELARVKSEAAEKGLKDSLGAYLNLVGYDRALRNIQGKAATALREYKRLKANADKLHTEIKLGIEPEMRLPEVVNLRKQAREQRQIGKDFLTKLKSNAIVPEGYSRASVAQDLRLLQQDLGPADYAKVEGWANRVYGELKKSWDDLYQSGIISHGVHEKGELLGRGYIPLARILEVTHDVNRSFGSSSMNVRTRKSLQELEGSQLYNVDPFDAALNQIQVASREVQKNNVAGAVLNLAHMDPTGYGQAIGVPKAGYKLGTTEGTMVHWSGGQKITYVVPRFLASVIENATPAGSAVVGATALRTTAQSFRLGATLANLRFSVPNATRDIQDYASLSKTGLIIKGVLHPFEFGKIVHDWITTLKHTIAEDEEYLQMMRARAGFSTIQRNISASPETLRVNALKVGGLNPFSKVIHTIEQFNDIVENNTKLTAFKRSKELIMRGKQGPLSKAQLDAVAWETRNYGGSPDFASKGTMSAAINLLWMFFNAKVQGTGRTVKRMLEPKRAAMLLGTYTMMGLALMGHNMQFLAPENDGTFEYQHIPETDKQNYYIIITPGTYHTSTGGVRHNYFKVSKGHLGQLISNPIEDAIEGYTLGHGDIGQTALNFAGNMLPGQFNFREGHIAQGSVSGAISSWNPLIKEPIDQARNQDSFKSIPIEPKGMENLENPERYDPNTSLTTRRVARVIYDISGKDQGLAKAPIIGPMLTSPMRLQHAISGFGAGVADDALRIADYAQGQDKTSPVPLEGTEALAHTPVVGGLVSRFVGSPLDQIEKDLETEFYSAAETATLQKGTFDHMARTNPQAAKDYFKDNKKSLQYSEAVIGIQKTLGELRNTQKQVLADPKLEAGQKQARIQKLHEARIKLLKLFHEKLAPKLAVTN